MEGGVQTKLLPGGEKGQEQSSKEGKRKNGEGLRELTKKRVGHFGHIVGKKGSQIRNATEGGESWPDFRLVRRGGGPVRGEKKRRAWGRTLGSPVGKGTLCRGNMEKKYRKKARKAEEKQATMSGRVRSLTRREKTKPQKWSDPFGDDTKERKRRGGVRELPADGKEEIRGKPRATLDRKNGEREGGRAHRHQGGSINVQ